METAIKAGKLILTVDKSQNVTVVADVNSLTSTTQTLGDIMKRTGLYVLRAESGRTSERSGIPTSKVSTTITRKDDLFSRAPWLSISLIWNAVVRFRISSADDITVEAGTAINAVVVTVAVQLVGSMEIAYITVNLT